MERMGDRGRGRRERWGGQDTGEDGEDREGRRRPGDGERMEEGYGEGWGGRRRMGRPGEDGGGQEDGEDGEDREG